MIYQIFLFQLDLLLTRPLPLHVFVIDFLLLLAYHIFVHLFCKFSLVFQIDEVLFEEVAEGGGGVLHDLRTVGIVTQIVMVEHWLSKPDLHVAA